MNVWHANGQKKTEGNLLGGYRDGLWVVWHANGQKEFEGTYKKGREKRGAKWWDENGNKKKPEYGVEW